MHIVSVTNAEGRTVLVNAGSALEARLIEEGFVHDAIEPMLTGGQGDHLPKELGTPLARAAALQRMIRAAK